MKMNRHIGSKFEQMKAASELAVFFPYLKRGHGGTHGRCVVKDCKGGIDHKNDQLECALTFIRGKKK